MKVIGSLICLLFVVSASSAQEFELRWVEFSDHYLMGPEMTENFPGQFEAVFQIVDSADPDGPPLMDFYSVWVVFEYPQEPVGWPGPGIFFCGQYPPQVNVVQDPPGTYHVDFTATGGITTGHSDSYKESVLTIGFWNVGWDYVVELSSPPFITSSPDLDGLLQVDLIDFARFQTYFGTSSPYADYTGDGLVDLADFAIFGQEFGNSCSYLP